MSTTTINATQSSAAGGHRDDQSQGPALPISSPLSATLVNTAPAVNKRPSVKLKVVGGKSDVVNSALINAAGKSLYSISSDSKHTTVIACKDNVKVATVEWNRSSPRMTLRQKKMKCKEWLPLARPDRPETEARILTHGDSQLIWMNKSSTSGYLIPANRPGLSVARWRIRTRSDDLDLEIFQEALVESGLLEAIVISIVLLRSGRSFGDTTTVDGWPSGKIHASPGVWPATAFGP